MLALALVGQIAWAVENSWFNTFVFDTITPDPRPVAWMVCLWFFCRITFGATADPHRCGYLFIYQTEKN
jgi:hypothetical protein